MALDQSLSSRNFRKIFDIENRRGNYLEGRFFPDVEKVSKKIRICLIKARALKSEKATLSEADFEEKRKSVSDELKELRDERDKLLDSELSKVSDEVSSKGFSIGINEVNVGHTKSAYVADDTAGAYFSLKQIQHNIHRLYKVKQANRHHIICQLREILCDQFPKYIIRTDISSFYESVPREKLLKKLQSDPLLTLASKRIIRRVLFEYSQITGKDLGLPRGIGFSAYLAELYMRDFDSVIRDYPGVLYYARYVDDIMIIFSPPPNVGVKQFYRAVARAFTNAKLKRNRKKTQTHKLGTGHGMSVEYLGYKITVASGTVQLNMTAKKLDRYKKRIDASFDAYNKQAQKSEKPARALLEKRIRFLTGNTRLVNNKKNVVAGVFFSNPLLTDLSDLRALDQHLGLKVAMLQSIRMKRRLSDCSFEKGFSTCRYHKFSAQELSEIVEGWKNVA